MVYIHSREIFKQNRATVQGHLVHSAVGVPWRYKKGGAVVYLPSYRHRFFNSASVDDCSGNIVFYQARECKTPRWSKAHEMAIQQTRPFVRHSLEMGNATLCFS